MNKPEKLKGSIVASIVLHAALATFGLMAPSIFAFEPTDPWGSNNPGEGLNVKLVGSISGIALPSPEVVTENAAANESEGFYKSEPAPTPPPPPEKAEPIPDTKAPVKVTKTTKVEPTPDRTAKTTKTKTEPETPSNAVPYGEGGKPALAYGQFTSQSGDLGAGFGDGAFGAKYSFYVQTMIRKISQNWIKGLVDNRVTGSPRVYMTFDISRDGTISNIAVKQSSNIPTLDRSAQRALLASNKLPPLPTDYTGSKVSVSFYFEYIK